MSESSEELKRIAAAMEEILRLVKKDMEDVKKRSQRNNRRAVEALQDAWPGLQPASNSMYYRRQAGQSTRQRVSWMLRPEGPVSIQ